jgi:hypothetical protein
MPSPPTIVAASWSARLRARLREVIGQLDRAAMTAVDRALLLVLGFA